jgi:glycosyltransferase involved in cell wall biosynthesis
MSIVWAVNRLFSDPAGAEERRRRAVVEVESNYSWRHIAKRTAALYHDVVAERQNTEW